MNLCVCVCVCSARRTVAWACGRAAFSASPITSAVCLWSAAGPSAPPRPSPATTAPVRAAPSGSPVPGVRYDCLVTSCLYCVSDVMIRVHSFFSSPYTQNLSSSHRKLSLKQQKHKPNLQNQTLILSLFNFIKHDTVLCVIHKNLTGMNIMEKVFANVCF